jgi:hypothetical protein
LNSEAPATLRAAALSETLRKLRELRIKQTRKLTEPAASVNIKQPKVGVRGSPPRMHGAPLVNDNKARKVGDGRVGLIECVASKTPKEI